MHRHAYQGRKLSLERDQRKALLRGLVNSLVLHEQISTTEAKAKEAAPMFERLVTKAKQGDLASMRSIRQVLFTENAVQKLLLELTPAFSERNGGYTRIVKSGTRRGDNADMAILALVLPPKLASVDTTAKAVTAAASKSSDEKPKSAPKANANAAKTKVAS
ncbi:MAG: 50S ribosomal protein L17 [Candidatus Saccharimonadia bacterium]